MRRELIVTCPLHSRILEAGNERDGACKMPFLAPFPPPQAADSPSWGRQDSTEPNGQNTRELSYLTALLVLIEFERARGCCHFGPMAAAGGGFGLWLWSGDVCCRPWLQILLSPR